MKAKIKEIAQITVEFTLDTILPPRCVVTGEMVDRQGMISPQAWAKLDFINNPMCQKCGVPFGFEVDGFDAEGGLQCLSCLDYPPPYETARAALKYNDQSRNMILGFKHADQTHNVLAFLPWLKNAGTDMLSQADLIIPVPLHRLRLIKRRYNQAAIMANYLGGETNIPVLHNALIRTRATQTQGNLNFQQRRKNVKSAFNVPEKHKEALKDKTIIIIDDVYTTGATVKECTKALLRNGVKSVHILTLARVVRYND
ncbi:MAG: ComF family protein [Bdellovibrionales bacterium]